jgi:tetratricopeptide (TPR) repeat protein
MDVNLQAAHWDLADAYVEKKMYPEAAAEWQKALTLSGNSALASALGEAYRVSGFQGFLRTWTDHDSNNSLAGANSYETSRRFVLRGKKEEAVSWLRKALADKSGGLARLRADPVFDPIRSDPSFQAIMKEINFPE